MHHRAIALIDLGLPLEDFWTLSPRELYVFHRRHDQARAQERLLVGILACATANFSFSRPKTPLTPHDFGLAPKPKSPALALPEQDQIKGLRMAFRAMAGMPPLLLIRPENSHADEA